MKALITLLLALPMYAHAAPFLVMDFNKDVKIFLSTTSHCLHGGMKAYAAKLDGTHVDGCYAPKTIDGKLWIRIVWVFPATGQVDFSEFTAASFTSIDNKQTNFKADM